MSGTYTSMCDSDHPCICVSQMDLDLNSLKFQLLAYPDTATVQ